MGSKAFHVDCTVKGNFCVQVFAVTPGIFGGKKRVCELWNSTLMMPPTEDEGCFLDFPSSELNIKKKMKKKIDGLTLRLGFGFPKAPVSGDAGIEMQAIVTRNQQSFSTQL